MFSVSIYTLGCKLNQLESESIADAFRTEGFRILPWEDEEYIAHEADKTEEYKDLAGATPEDQRAAVLLVVNTCTVTSKAEQKARRIIRKALRDHPEAVLMVTGCYAQMDPQDIAALETDRGVRVNDGCFAPHKNSGSVNRFFVLGGDQKSALIDLPRFFVQAIRAFFHETAKGTNAGTLLPCQSIASIVPVLLSQWVQDRIQEVSLGQAKTNGQFRFNPGDFSFHSRASLKIQDGCDNSCSYCRVSLARGPSVSLGAERVLSSLKRLEEKGYGEAVLTGVNISQYQDGSLDLGSLLDYLLMGTEHIRLRLSSLEPEEITPRFISVLADPRICPHFHLSVQSGNSRILEDMGRTYTAEDIEQGVNLLRSVKEDPFLACDIIAGFPGETGEAFEKTYKLCQYLDFTWIHAFPYSPRPGTRAYSFKKPVGERESRLRVDRLLGLGAERRQQYIHRWMGKTVEGIVETHSALSPPLFAAVSANYLKLLLSLPGENPPKPGSVLQCQLIRFPDRTPELSYFDAVAEAVKGAAVSAAKV